MLTPDPGVVEYLESDAHFYSEWQAAKYNVRGVQAVRRMIELVYDHCPFVELEGEDGWHTAHPDSECRCHNPYPGMLASLADQWTFPDELEWLRTGNLRRATAAQARVNYYRAKEIESVITASERDRDRGPFIGPAYWDECRL